MDSALPKKVIDEVFSYAHVLDDQVVTGKNRQSR